MILQISLIQQLTVFCFFISGQLQGNSVKSMSITYHPPSSTENATYHSHYKVDIESAGSVALLIQTALPLLLFDPLCDQCSLQCIGGTNASFGMSFKGTVHMLKMCTPACRNWTIRGAHLAVSDSSFLILIPITKDITVSVANYSECSTAPQIDYFQLVLQPMLKQLMDIDITIECQQRGFFPKGGGRVTLTTNRISECIPAFQLTKRGSVKSLYGQVVVGGRGYKTECGELVAEGATQELRGFFGKNINLNIEVLPKDKVDSYSSGIGITVVAETTTGCLFGGSELQGPPKGENSKKRGKRKQQQQQQQQEVDYYGIGRNAASELITDWKSTKGGCTDRWLQDQLIIFMALAKGKSKMATCAMELHTETAIYIAELMTGVKFEVSNMKDGTVMIECVGIGYNASGVESVQQEVESAEQRNNEEEKKMEIESFVQITEDKDRVKFFY